jgi:hypothetical protein
MERVTKPISFHTHTSDILSLKADVTRVRRRIMVLRKDWKYMAAENEGPIWINKRGTTGQQNWTSKTGGILLLPPE